MDQVYIINLETFASYEDVSINIKPQRVAVFVKKAQDLDLKIFMGAAFYYDFIKWFEADETEPVTPYAFKLKNETPQPYKDLFNGVMYQNSAGHDIYFEGIVPAMIYFTFARFIEADAVHYTATGPVTKHHDSADPLKVGDIAKLVVQQRSVANAHLNEVIAFLEAKRADYPLYKYSAKNAKSRQPGPRFGSVDATEVNRAYGYGNNYGYPNGLLY